MNSQDSVDFLTQISEARLRREIINICDSYSHPWDALAELCQNAVDAIRAHQRMFDGREHQIDIRIDSRDRSISVTDTGVGFDVSDMGRLLAPHGTDKAPDATLIGEKGVGLTYTIFMCNRYELQSASASGSIGGYVEGGVNWRDGHQDELPSFVLTEYDEVGVGYEESGSKISLTGVAEEYPDDHEDLFRQNTEILEFWLRTNTAIGFLRGHLNNEALSIDVRLWHATPDDPTPEPRTIEFDFMWPQSMVDTTVGLEDAKSRMVSLNDAQTAKFLAGKALVKSGEFERAGRKIRYNAFFAPERSMWEEVSEKNNLTQTTADGAVIPLATGGIFLGTKGMPTGITIEPPQTGFAGYWPNFHILLEDDSLQMDLGRKSVPGRTKGMLKELAREIFLDFRPVATKASRNPTVTPSLTRRLEISKEFERLSGLSDLGVDAIRFAKYPDGQEAAVVAIFHELVATGLLKGYRIAATGYKRTYDAWGWYDTTHDGVGAAFSEALPDDTTEIPIVIEHKYKAESILTDFNRDQKFLGDIDLIVCWDIDITKFNKELVTVTQLSPSECLYHGTNYRLDWPAAYALGDLGTKDVLSLRQFVEGLAAQ